MHWYFGKEKEDDYEIVYRYSADGQNLDGAIRYVKGSESIEIINPCESDKNFKKGQEMTMQAFYHVVKEQFPQSRHICCG